MSISKLVVFDIDGTLTHTNPLDHACFIAAVHQFISKDFVEFIPSWFTHFTDSCIIIELFERYLHRSPTTAEERAFKTLYIEQLEQTLQEQPSYFKPIDGARAVLDALPADWGVALATGCWQEAAEIKLRGGGIPVHNRPMATASDALTRQAVMQTAIQRAQAYYQVAAFEHVVYIGDGLWDKQSCADIELPFVGIEQGNRNYQTGMLGDFHLLADYLDLPYFLELLGEAVAP
ncbi:MAG: HAD family hydrolase [Aureispira sp.]